MFNTIIIYLLTFIPSTLIVYIFFSLYYLLDLIPWILNLCLKDEGETALTEDPYFINQIERQ